jgi:hypothetical protein
VLRKDNFPFVTELTDVRTLPKFRANLIFYSAIGLFEFARLIAYAAFYDGFDLNDFLNLGIIVAAPSGLARIWLGRVTDESMDDLFFTVFVQAGMSFFNAEVAILAVASRLIFGAFRGGSRSLFLMRVVVLPLAVHSFCRTCGIPFIHTWPSRKASWFRKTDQRIPSAYSFWYFALYGIAGFVILAPIVPHTFDAIYREVEVDTNYLLVFVSAFMAYAAFFGLLKTVRRLQTGRLHWHDDHITMQGFVTVPFALFALYYAFAVKQLSVFDVTGLAFCGLGFGALVSSPVVFGTAASYFVSVAFVDVALIRRKLQAVDVGTFILPAVTNPPDETDPILPNS